MPACRVGFDSFTAHPFSASFFDRRKKSISYPQQFSPPPLVLPERPLTTDAFTGALRGHSRQSKVFQIGEFAFRHLIHRFDDRIRQALLPVVCCVREIGSRTRCEPHVGRYSVKDIGDDQMRSTFCEAHMVQWVEHFIKGDVVAGKFVSHGTPFKNESFAMSRITDCGALLLGPLPRCAHGGCRRARRCFQHCAIEKSRRSARQLPGAALTDSRVGAIF